MLAGIQVPACQALLYNLNVFIGNTGATVHSTPRSIGMVNLTDTNGGEQITVANGMSVAGSQIGNVIGTVCDKHENTKGAAQIRETILASGNKYNLFLITKMLDEGWTLGRDSKSIWIKKGNLILRYDMKNKDTKGMPICGHVSEINGTR